LIFREIFPDPRSWNKYQIGIQAAPKCGEYFHKQVRHYFMAENFFATDFIVRRKKQGRRIPGIPALGARMVCPRACKSPPERLKMRAIRDAMCKNAYRNRL
jgi:hypothetical protein